MQATAVGTSSKEELNIDLNFKPGQLVLEMHYSPVITNFLAAAINHGAVPCFGSQMLYQQMIAQYRAGVSPNPDAKMLTSLEQHLAANLPGSPPIILCGPRASGKTSLGRALAAQLGRRFFDADELLEKRNQIKISDWIPKNLESFRDAESELLEELVQYQDAVLALGGGVVERDNNRELLARQSAVYYLNAEHQTLLHRQSSQPRPALTDKNLSDEITLLSQRRHPWYMQAAKDRIIATDGDFETVLSLLHNMVS